MNRNKQNEAIDNLYDRGKKLLSRINQATKYEEPLADSVVIADIPRENQNLRSIDTLDKVEVLEYSLNQVNGSVDNSHLKDSISNSYIDSSENGNSRIEGIVNSDGKFIKVDISQYKNLLLKYGKIIFNNSNNNNSPFVNNNDILYLESKIPIFKAKSSGEIIYDTLKNYHQQGSDREDSLSVVNINQSNTHKVTLDESNFAAITGNKIFVFLHKIIQGNFRKKNNNGAKNSSPNSTEVITNSDIIIGYSTLDMNKIFLSSDFKYTAKLDVIEKKKVVPKSKKSSGKVEVGGKNKKGGEKNLNSNNANKNDITDALYDEKGERVIGSLEITCHLKRPIQKKFQKDENIIKQINNRFQDISNNNNYNCNNNINIGASEKYYQFDNNNNINKKTDINNINNIKEFIVGPSSALYQPGDNNFNNINNKNFIQNKSSYLYNSSNTNNNFEEGGPRQNEAELNENEIINNPKEGPQKIQTDINGDILILYLKINELKASNDNSNNLNSQTQLNNLLNSNDITSQFNNNNSNFNNNQNKNIVFLNINGPQPMKRNFFIRHKIFPENSDTTSETVWNKVSPDFNYTIQMPFTLNQRTAELLDNEKFIIEIWIKGEKNNECLGIVSFELRKVLDALKVDDNTITTVQLYKNTFPYIIYDDYYQVTQISEAPDLGALFLKTCIGVGTPAQVNSFINLIKKTQQNTFNQFNNNNGGMINNNANINNGAVNNKQDNNKKNDNIDEENNNSKNNISLDPFKEENANNKNLINKDDINNISKAADINVDGIMEKNHKELANINISKDSSIFQKDTFKKSTSFDDQGNTKPKIVNPFLVPKNYDQGGDKIKKDTAGFGGSGSGVFNPEINNANAGGIVEGSNRYGNNYNSTNNLINNNINQNDKDIKINIGNEYEDNVNINNNKFNPEEELNNNKNNNGIHEERNNINKFDYNNEEINIHINNYNLNDNNKNNNEENEEQNDLQENENNMGGGAGSQDISNSENQNDDLKEEIGIYNNQNTKKMNLNINNNGNQNQLDEDQLMNNSNPHPDFPPGFNPEGEKKQQLQIQMGDNNALNASKDSHVKKHIFIISIEKIYNCQILSKLPPTYLRYQFFTDQKPLRSELFNFSSYSIDSSIIDVDMKSAHSIILPKVEKIKDYLNDFLVEFLYDNTSPNTLKPSRDDQIVIGRVNIPSDEFSSLIGEKEIDNSINENTRVLFIYGTEKIQRNKCIIGKLKLNIKYISTDVPINHNINQLFNGSLSLLNNNNNNLLISSNQLEQSKFCGSIYLEKETIFNRKIPKNACLKINVKNFVSTSLFEDYFRRQFSISFVFSAFGEVNKMESQYGKRSTTKKHNLLNCEFNEMLSYKLEIDQDIIDYLKCRSGIVYLMYKVVNEPKNYNYGDFNNNNINNLIIDDNDEDGNDENLEKNINTMDLANLGNNKRIIGKGIYTLNDILTSADTSHQEINIAQIGNGSMSLGVLNISLTLENDNSNINLFNNNEEGTADKENKDISSPINKFKKGMNNTTSDLYKFHNKTLNKCEPSFYLNGKFLFSIDFRKFYYEINSEIGTIINNSQNNFYFVFRLGNKIKKISPKFNKDNNELFSLNFNCNLLLINYVEMIELDLNFNKKFPGDIYNLFNEGIFEIKLYQTDNSNSLGSFYIDLHKLITSEFYSENILYSGNNVINLVDVRNNSYKNSKIELNLTIFKLNEMQLNIDIMNKMNYLNNNNQNINNDNNMTDLSVSNLDYCEYYQILFVKEFAESLLQNIFNDILITDKEKENKGSQKDKEMEKEKLINNLNDSDQGLLLGMNNSLTIEKLKKIFLFNSIDMFTFIHTNLIPLLDTKGEININNFKKVFKFITKLNYDIFEYYLTTKNENGSGSNLAANTFDLYLNSRIINLDNEDINVFNYLKDKQNQIEIGINNNNSMNDKNNKTIKKLLTTKYNYGFNETNDYFDVVSLCLFLFDYFYNLNDPTLNNILKLKNLKTQPPLQNNKNNLINIPLSLTSNNYQPSLENYQYSSQPKTKIMVVSVLSGHNIIKPNSDFSSRPSCYFVLEFDDKNYTSDVVMNSSQPNFNEELEIKINSEEYVQKLNSLLIYINVYSFIDENGSQLIGKCEISPAKMFPFLNDNNECEDFFHIIGEEGQVMGQLNIKFKFENDILGAGLTSKTMLLSNQIQNQNNSILMSKVNPLLGQSNSNNNSNGNNINGNYYSNTVSLSSNNNNINYKNKLIMTADINDPLHKKLAEAMNTIDNLTQILQGKVQNNNNIQINQNNFQQSFKMRNNMNNNNNFQYINKKINNQRENLSDIKSEENLINSSNDKYLPKINQQQMSHNNEFNNNEEIENEMELMNNGQYEEEDQKIIDGNNNNLNDEQLKMYKTDYDRNYMFGSQKFSGKGDEEEDEDKVSYYSDTKGDEKNKGKPQNYDKKLLSKIKRVMKNEN